MVRLPGKWTVFLGRKEVPYTLREGDRWTNEAGDSFLVGDGEVVIERLVVDSGLLY